MIAADGDRVLQRIMDDERGNDQHWKGPQQRSRHEGMAFVPRPYRQRIARYRSMRFTGGHGSVCGWLRQKVSKILRHVVSLPRPARSVNQPCSHAWLDFATPPL